MMYRLTVLLAFALISVPGTMAQGERVPITADNVTRLGSVSELDFDDLPAEAGQVLNGRVYISDDGGLIAVVNSSSQIVMLNDEFDLLHVSDVLLANDDFPATFIDGSFGAGDQPLFAALHAAGDGYYVSVLDTDGKIETAHYASNDQPAAIWLNEGQVWLEVMPQEASEMPYLLQLDLPLGGSGPVRHPFAPAQDEDAVVRIGRLPQPLAITVTAEGEVRRWHLQTGELTAAAQVDEIPIYGYAAGAGDNLLWRDPASAALHVLDFASGEDRAVVELAGAYIPFIFLTLQADVILGVDVNDEPVVVAWDVETATYHSLGLYRQCQRPPDMVRLSQDGTTLVIGCDAGLDVWRVQL